ncbi:MAG: hypothetical protein JW741_23595 [Sedimentisphaerales bacterium]|nr:hypothetical protein [Sedimentisphaerales bacterium]
MSIIETGKEIAKLAQQLGSIEIQQKVIELQNEVLAMQGELQQLRSENTELKDRSRIDDELELRENAYWRPSAPVTRQGPFCKTCWDTQKLMVSLNVREDGHQDCPSCKGQFPTSESRRVQQHQQQQARAEQERLARALQPKRFR